MPRQLPWLNKAGGSGTRTQEQSSKAAPKPRIQSDVDDDFFADTVLASDPRVSDNGFPELPNTVRGRVSRKDKGKEPVGRSRMPSSSPPPADELPPLEIDYMDKGVDKFDLRDDEFMMVEDELLQTAKLFTRHLHLAEYEKMKTEIEEKKSRNEKTPRPVVVGVKPSIEGQFKKKAHEQAKAQNTFFDAEDASEQEESSMRQAAMTNRTIPSTKTRVNNGSDSDDLDAPQPPTTTKYTAPLKPPPKQLSRPAESTAELPSSSFVKPALPALSNANARARARARAARMNRPSSLIDEWDGFKPNDTSPARRSSSPVKHAAEDSDRFAKRKAEKGKEARSKAQKMEADDIPTFMF